jgi:hypothetical protein
MLTITTLFLIAVFLAAEFYRFKHRIAGSIIKIQTLDGDPTGFMGARVQVRTAEKGEITAFVSGCQICAVPISIGERVWLVPCMDGYLVSSPWIYNRRRGSCPKGAVL